MLTKAKASGQDPYLAILHWRNTPSPSTGSSSVQRLFGRRTKTLLPTTGTFLQPKIMEETKGRLKERKTKQALFYNKIDHVICHMTIFLKNLKIEKTGGGFKKRGQAVSFFHSY